MALLKRDASCCADHGKHELIGAFPSPSLLRFEGVARTSLDGGSLSHPTTATAADTTHISGLSAASSTVSAHDTEVSTGTPARVRTRKMHQVEWIIEMHVNFSAGGSRTKTNIRRTQSHIIYQIIIAENSGLFFPWKNKPGWVRSC